jgi:hypothetical protein
VGLGAVVVLTMETETGADAGKDGQKPLVAQPLCCVDAMGRSMLERTVQHLLNTRVENITLLVPKDLPGNCPPLTNHPHKVKVERTDDPFSALNDVLKRYADEGVEHAFILSGSLYAETDLLDFVYFHREAKKGITRAFDHEGPLDLWVVDCAQQSPLGLRFDRSKRGVPDHASYFIAGYVRRLQHPSDLRAIITDSLRGICAMRPCGQEVRPGIWVDEGAEIDRRARIVAPAYIGCNSKVREDALVTRCSSIERDCCIDFGTIVEDSSILANTRVGIWLDVRHAVASGSKLMSLKHDVLLEIADLNVMRFNGALPNEEIETLNEKRERAAEPAVSKMKPEAASERWQLGANLIQG